MDPRPQDLLYHLSYLLLHNGAPERARALLRYLHLVDPGNETTALALVWACVESDEPQEAYQVAVGLPWRADGLEHLLTGKACARLQLHKEAAEAMRRYIARRNDVEPTQ